MNSSNTQSGFSLVEVAISLGICSFVLISLFGLMSVGLDSGKQAAEDTSVAVVAKTAINDLKTNSYSILKAGYTMDRYFDFGGVDTTNSSSAHFLCRVEVLPHLSPDLPAYLRNVDRAIRARLTIIAPAASGRTNSVLETTIASY